MNDFLKAPTNGILFWSGILKLLDQIFCDAIIFSLRLEDCQSRSLTLGSLSPTDKDYSIGLSNWKASEAGWTCQ